ncbi:MFS transporter [Tessaracoccus antarcticus]|uniref:MFS transporter n=1 Tax=Tessaracoccus antarcticus TaxID=2479848 RepID=A0A3M0GIY6_9ACTN|nr:MFS transporter [Tessaracoccus antarcticus]RMB57256.1 MFS transporter [Tessaracoccus antarcticus]
MSFFTQHTSAAEMSHRRQWAALAVLMLPVLLISVDNTVLSFALPLITEDLGPSASTQLWIMDIYALVLAALLITMGSLSDRFGRRRLLIIGAVGFALVSVAAAFASTPGQLVAARAALGGFGAMLMPSTLSLLRNIFIDPMRRRKAIAIWATGFAAGSSLGPILGGVLLEHFHWGAVFLISVPILFPLLLLYRFLLPESKDPSPGPVDLLSVALSFAGMFLVVWSIKTLAHEATTIWPVVAAMAGAFFIAWFIRRQLRATTPLLDVRLFTYLPFTASVLANFLSVVSLISFIFFISQHLQLVLELSPLKAGLVLLPGAILSVIAGIGVVGLSKRWAPKWLMAVGLVLIAIGYASVVVFRGDFTVAAILLAFGLIEIGIGMSQTLSSDTIIGSVPPEKAGSASAISETAYELGAVVGTATLGTMITAFYRANISLPAGLTAQQMSAAAETLGGAAAVADEVSASTADALMTSARLAFDSGVGWLGVLGTLLSLSAAAIVLIGFKERRLADEPTEQPTREQRHNAVTVT